MASNKRYFGGGTVEVNAVASHEAFFKEAESAEEAFEDGTLNFQGILGVGHGIDTWNTKMNQSNHLARHAFSVARHLARRLEGPFFVLSKSLLFHSPHDWITS